MEELYTSILLFFAGLAASFINMMAGGGSILTVGLMILLGIEPTVANGTNRIGVLMGTFSGTLTYKSEKLTDLKTSITLGLIALPGAIIGSLISVNITNDQFQNALSVVMILIVISMFLPKRKGSTQQQNRFLNIIKYPSIFLVGVYGGFIQIGVGFLLMAVLKHIMNFDLLTTNMHKIFIVLIYTVPILFIFGLNNKIDWLYAIIMSSGNMLGSWLSVKLAIKKGDKFVKIILAISIVLMAIKFLLFP